MRPIRGSACCSSIRKVYTCTFSQCAIAMRVSDRIHAHNFPAHVLISVRSPISSIRHIQFSVAVLRVPGRRGQHHVGDPGEADQVVVHVRHMLSGRQNVHHRFFALLQAGHPAVLSGQAADGVRHHFPAILWPLSRWRLERQRRLHLHHRYLQHIGVVGAVRLVPVLLCDPRFADAVRAGAQVLHRKIRDFLVVLAG